ncbi:pitrilysin family protein [Stakelama sediminis]|uniref:Zinc protease n=1 Tax=Stakelama sediminis TaxID=463200 RepID=A0A840YW97_9SPHN|nr:pitrilysin family protein [Stakelama sediminis]MBB5717845.1 zinc protease [Stakelama sediminis]
MRSGRTNNPSFKRTIRIAGAAALALATVTGGPALAASPAAAPAVHQDVTRATLKNGLRVVIVRDPLAPVVTTEMNYLAGSDEVPQGFPGTAHAVEHMMFRGSPGLNKDQIAALAANMGGQFNADTTEGVTQYFFTVPVQDLGIALHIHALRMRGVDMQQAQWAKERGAIEQEVSRDMSNPTFKFYTQLRDRMFKGSPYAHTPLGTRDSFNKTTAAALKKFHDTWYAPNNAILVIAGDVDPQTTLKEVRSMFSAIPRKQLPTRPDFKFQPVQAHTIQLPSDLPYGLALISYRMPSLRAKDYATALVLSQAMGSKRGKLFEMGLSGKALYGGFSGDFLPHSGLAYAEGVFPRGGKSDGVLQTMQAIMADTAANGIPADLVEAAKRRAIADLEYQKNSVSGLANAWSQALAFADAQSPDSVKAAIEAVTPAQVDALAKQVFNPDHAITAILTPQDSGKPVSSKGFGGAENFGGQPNGPVTLPSWARAQFATLPQPQSAIHPTAFTLPNGLRVIVQPEKVSKTVEVFGRVKTNQDMQAAKGHEGVADVLDDMFSFGTTHLNRLQFQAALDAISAHESAGKQFSLAVPVASFEKGVQLLADNELNPAMPAQAFAIMQKREAAQTAGLLKSPDFLNTMSLNKALLPAGDPELRYPTVQSIGALTLADIKSYYTQTYRPDMTTIVVIGDVTPEQAKQVIGQAFGGWKATGPKPETDYPAVPLNASGSQFNTPAATAVQDSVMMAQQVGITDHSEARYALNVGNTVLSGGFYAARLTRDLREKRGLVYTVGSGLDLDQNRGRYRVYFGSDPDKVAEAHDLIVRDMKQMQDAPVTADELHQAKGMLLRQLPLSEASFGSIAGQLLKLSLENKPLDSNLIAAQHYRSLTAPQVQAAFRQYIRPDAFVTAVKGPAPKGG